MAQPRVKRPGAELLSLWIGELSDTPVKIGTEFGRGYRWVCEPFIPGVSIPGAVAASCGSNRRHPGRVCPP